MKDKILCISLLLLGSGLFAQTKLIGSLDSIKKIAPHNKELIGTWTLDTVTSNKVMEGHKPKPVKSLHVGHNVTQWTFSANKNVTSAPYNEDKLSWSMNNTKDSIFLWASVSQTKAALVVKMQLKELDRKKMVLSGLEGSDERITLFLNRKEK